MSPKVLVEILRVFVTGLTADDKYPVQDCENMNFQFKCSFLKNQNLFLNCLFHFCILHQILNILKENMIVIANAFPKSLTVKIFVRKLSKERRFRTGYGSQQVTASQMPQKYS